MFGKKKELLPKDLLNDLERDDRTDEQFAKMIKAPGAERSSNMSIPMNFPMRGMVSRL